MAKAKKRSGWRAHGGGDGFMIAGKAGDQRGAVDAVAVQFVRPDLGQFFRLGGRQLPVELRLHGFERQSGLLRGKQLERSGARKNAHGRRQPAKGPTGTAARCVDR